MYIYIVAEKRKKNFGENTLFFFIYINVYCSYFVVVSIVGFF